jgi:hypothetical protein
MPQPPYPLHPSIADKIHPDYAAFYNKHIIDKQQVHFQPVSASRSSGILIPGGGPLLPVGKTEDFAIKRTLATGPDVIVRCFTPSGPKPVRGWPVFIYYHGGGWVLGNIDTENTVGTNICNRVGCVVVSVDYRYFSFLSHSLILSSSPSLRYSQHKLKPLRQDSLPKLPGQPPLMTPGKQYYGHKPLAPLFSPLTSASKQQVAPPPAATSLR